MCLPRNLHMEVHKVLRLPRNLHFKVHKVPHLPRSLQTSYMSKSHDSLHLSGNQSVPKITTMSKVLHLPRHLHFEVKPLQSLAPVRKGRLCTTKTRRFPCACHGKPSCPKMRTAPQRERSPDKHPPRRRRFCEPAQSKCTSTILRGT